MKGSDKVEMTLNIGGEILTMETDFDKQNLVREAEFAVRQFYNKLRREWPNSSDRKILAMAAYQFSFWRQELLAVQRDALDLVEKDKALLDMVL